MFVNVCLLPQGGSVIIASHSCINTASQAQELIHYDLHHFSKLLKLVLDDKSVDLQDWLGRLQLVS